MKKIVEQYMEKVGISPWQVFPHDMEKFAELIVKECIAEIDRGIVTDPSSRRPEIVSVLTRRLQQHFGVEE